MHVFISAPPVTLQDIWGSSQHLCSSLEPLSLLVPQSRLPLPWHLCYRLPDSERGHSLLILDAARSAQSLNPEDPFSLLTLAFDLTQAMTF